MIYLIAGLVILIILVAPQLLISHIIKKYNVHSGNIPGSGAQFARHLLNRLKLDKQVSVEETDQGDHYDPQSKTVRLNKLHFHQHSLSAMVIAAHEVGHAIQDAENYPWLTRRTRLVKLNALVEKIAPAALALAPVLLAITKSPVLSFLTLLTGVLAISLSTLTHLITLPVELDASFHKALPLLASGNYLDSAKNYRAANTLLKAAAMTYVAQSLFNILNVAYWIRLFRS